MISVTTTRQESLELARAINREARSKPESRYAGKFVGIARGQVVVVADSLPQCLDALDKAEPDRLERVCLEASADYDGPHEVWSH